MSTSLLKDGDCRTGAAFDIMNGQLGWSRPPAPGDAERWCRPDRVIDYFPSCAPQGDDARRRCVARFEALKRDGAPVIPALDEK